MSQKRQIITAAGLMAAAGIFAATQAYGGVVIGNWTNGQSNGWFDWNGPDGNGGNAGASSNPLPSSLFSYVVDGQVPGNPSGDSLLQTHQGYAQTLALKLEYESGDMAAFWANNAIQFQLTFPSAASQGSTSGYSQIYQIALNAPGWGFTGIDNPVSVTQTYFWSTAPMRTETFTISYASALPSIEAQGYGPSNTGYAEFIFSTNNGSGAPSLVYFDQISLVTVPEPASLGLLGLAATALLARRRHR